MNRYIKLSDAIQAIESLPDCYNGFSDAYDKSCIIGVLEELPSADAVPVVRCKDCVYCKKHTMFELEYCQCERIALVTYPIIEPDDFCSYGKKVTE